MTQLDILAQAAASEGDWTKLPPDESREHGRLYRWRLDPKAQEPDEYVDRAHPLFEVEFWDWEEEIWRPVRYYTRRDEIWRAVREEVATP